MSTFNQGFQQKSMMLGVLQWQSYRGNAARLSSRNSFRARWHDSSCADMLPRRSSTRGSEAKDTTLPALCMHNNSIQTGQQCKHVTRTVGHASTAQRTIKSRSCQCLGLG